jgi:hypothetical protein
MSQCANQLELKRITRETANGLRQSLAAGQQVTTKLIVSGLSDRLRDEHVVAELAQRSMTGENAFALLVREIIREEAEQIVQITVAGLQEAA